MRGRDRPWSRDHEDTTTLQQSGVRSTYGEFRVPRRLFDGKCHKTQPRDPNQVLVKTFLKTPGNRKLRSVLDFFEKTRENRVKNGVPTGGRSKGWAEWCRNKCDCSAHPRPADHEYRARARDSRTAGAVPPIIGRSESRGVYHQEPAPKSRRPVGAPE